jgi:hypothetical protein
MSVDVVIAPFGAVMLDCLVPLTQADLDALAGYVLPNTRTGVTLFGRYLENLTAAECGLIFNHPARYGLLCIGESRANGYVPSASQGQQDGAREVAKYNALGLPRGGGIVWDAEGMGGTAADTTASGNAYAAELQGNGNQAIAYVGDSVPLSPAGLYALLETLYWHSLSNVQQVATCDYAMIQGYPTQNLDLPGVGYRSFDVSMIYRDKRGRGPMMLRASS